MKVNKNQKQDIFVQRLIKMLNKQANFLITWPNPAHIVGFLDICTVLVIIKYLMDGPIVSWFLVSLQFSARMKKPKKIKGKLFNPKMTNERAQSNSNHLIKYII